MTTDQITKANSLKNKLLSHLAEKAKENKDIEYKQLEEYYDEEEDGAIVVLLGYKGFYKTINFSASCDEEEEECEDSDNYDFIFGIDFQEYLDNLDEDLLADTDDETNEKYEELDEKVSDKYVEYGDYDEPGILYISYDNLDKIICDYCDDCIAELTEIYNFSQSHQ